MNVCFDAEMMYGDDGGEKNTRKTSKSKRRKKKNYFTQHDFRQ
jgi:hypothetical protein